MIGEWGRPLLTLLFAGASLAAGAVHAQQILRPDPPPGHVAGMFGDAMTTWKGELGVLSASTPGLVSIYTRSGGAWHAVQHMPAEPRFSMYRLAMGETWLAIATRDIGATGWPNYVDMYRRTAAGWSFAQRLNSPAPSFKGYVRNLVVSDSTVAISLGEWNANDVLVRSRVYTYTLEGDLWGEARELVPPFDAPLFGEVMAANAHMLVFGDPTFFSGGTRFAISTFVRENDEWRFVSSLGASIPDGYAFGRAMALCGSRLVVSTTGRTSGASPPVQGYVTVYHGGPEQWVAEGAPIVTIGGLDPTFGSSLACSESTLAIRSTRTKGAYALSFDGDRQVRQYIVTDPEASSGGFEVAVAGGDLFIGDPHGPWLSGAPQNDGAVYVYSGVGEFILVQGFD